MSRRSKETRFNVALCINDIVDHVDFNACSYTHITQVKSNFAKIDLRDTPVFAHRRVFKGFEGYCRPS